MKSGADQLSKMVSGPGKGARRPPRYTPLTYVSQRCLSVEPPRLQMRLISERVAFAENLYRRDLKGHYGCVNAIEFSNAGGEWIASGGDDRRVMLWNTEKALSNLEPPVSMKGEHSSNIFCLAFDHNNKKVFSGGNDEQVVVHDIATGETLDVFLHKDAVYGLTVDPNNDHVFASACDDGRILIYDIREPPTSDPFCLANYSSSMHAVMYNPMEPRLLATANAKEGIGLWDIRKPRSCLLRYGGNCVQQSCMSVRINKLGDKIIALRRRMPPVLYNIHSAQPVCEFEQSGYYNSCTMKSCCFAGERDQYILSGSDDFNLYLWRIPEDLSHRLYINKAHLVLRGHRSIVNQVRFNPSNHLIISSGVEKVVKIWSPFPLPGSEGGLSKDTTYTFPERPVYTQEEYINLVLRSGHIMSHDYTHQSMEEDPRMMAFFDSLVQRELEGWSSDDDYSTNDDELYERIVQASRSEVSDSASPSNSDDDEGGYSPFTIAFASAMTSRTGHSRLLEPEENEENDVEVTNDRTMMEGQRPSSNRKSISQLIAQKKKESQLLSAKHVDNTGAGRSKGCGKRPRIVSSSDSSEDEEDETVAPSKVKKKMSVISSESEDVDGCVDNRETAAQKQKAIANIKKWKDLRNQVLATESEFSESSLDVLNSRTVEDKNDTNSQKVQEMKKIVSVDQNPKKDEPELGPYLQQADLNSNEASVVNSNHTVERSISSACMSEEQTENRLSPQPSTTCSSDRHGVTDSEPVWTEFKRFKHRVERARHYYRQHHQSQQMSSDDETT